MSNKRFAGLAFSVALVLGAGAPTARAADPDFCRDYAQGGVTQAREARSHRRCDRLIAQNPARWTLDFKAHFDWCRAVRRGEAERERADRTHDLDGCTGH
jgi:hypothetical protein